MPIEPKPVRIPGIEALIPPNHRVTHRHWISSNSTGFTHRRTLWGRGSANEPTLDRNLA